MRGAGRPTNSRKQNFQVARPESARGGPGELLVACGCGEERWRFAALHDEAGELPWLHGFLASPRRARARRGGGEGRGGARAPRSAAGTPSGGTRGVCGGDFRLCDAGPRKAVGYPAYLRGCGAVRALWGKGGNALRKCRWLWGVSRGNILQGAPGGTSRGVPTPVG